ncbi:hypothetical protein [Microbacterium sp.]|uniref:hypothetical protein n=1 Tax=Microbacterium sp. TaxID=51671 RepID=UPI000928E2E2|nr:hypothetical protein [Microbacterium sp.]OJU56803.1 MAG: hypothetical protein BGO04_11555 [Microbacterium sp. 70-38]MBN9179258.1 hypothetical protein [Microbacterium sp.]MBN9185682.1 hypothetical protein [Microbacterium sp.]MBN9190814.1 hypothetical protein [Microbacterium sp.]MBN9191819.1 hypothetical protein [Microbacterium sp.]
MSSPFAAPYVPPAPGAYAPPTAERRGPGLGITAMVVALVAVPLAVGAAAVIGFRVGLGAGKEIAARPFGTTFDLSVLTPVRYDVLAGEIVFWTATALGVWALAQGIVALATARGRGPALIAVVVAALGPILFVGAAAVFVQAGMGAGSGIGG